LPLAAWLTCDPRATRYFIQIFLVGAVKRFSPRVCFGRSKSSKVIDFGTNRKRVCDFLLVRHSNLGAILHRFGDIAGFCDHDPPYSTLILGDVPVRPNHRWWGQPEHKP